MSDPALSFSRQPNFEHLVRCIVGLGTTNTSLTIICGAGLASDAGLPGWAELIDRMCSSVQPVSLVDIVRADPIDPMRKVDYIFRMRNKNKPEAELVRDALYATTGEPTPGHLADSIARLVRALNGGVRLLTTNFDNQLELALDRYFPKEVVKSFGLSDFDAFEHELSEGDSVPVLHLHGMVKPGEHAIEPIVLSEAYFLKYGPAVRDIVTRSLDNSVVIFVGVSMADPNLVGPLSDMVASGRSSNAYLLVAPDPIEEHSLQRSLEYTRRRCEYFEDNFKVHTVIVKSYAQVAQLLYDLSLAVSKPKRYLSSSTRSLRYGYRLRRALKQAYANLGATGKDGWYPSPERAFEMSARMYELLYGKNGIVSGIESLARRIPDDALAECGISREFLSEEHFAMFLWLRPPFGRNNDPEPPPYALRVLGSSAYAHREAWSFLKTVNIEPSKHYPAAAAAFYGRQRTTNISDTRLFRLWRSTIATPLTWADMDDERDVVSVGAVALNSTRPIVGQSDMITAHDSQKDVAHQLEPSVVSFLTDEDRDQIERLLHSAGVALIRPQA